MDKIFNRENRRIAKEELANNIFVYSTMVIIISMLFQIIWSVIFPVHDDIMAYLYVRKHLIKEATIDLAKRQGRFNFLFTIPISCFPYLFDNYSIFKLISYGTICFSTYMLWRLVRNNFGIVNANLVIIIFFAFAQIDDQHNLFVAYAFSHTLPIGILLASIDKCLEYCKNSKEVKIVQSAILLFVAALMYEAFICFSVIIFIIVAVKNYKDRKINFKKIIYTLRYHIILMGTYLTIYLIWRNFFPSTYDGALVKIGGIKDTFNTLITLGIGLFPLNSAMKVLDYIDILPSIKYSYIVKAILLMLVMIILLNKTEYINKKKAIVGIVLAIVGIFLPAVPHSITPKYVEWVKNGTYGYLPSFYGYFFIIILCCLLVNIIYQHTKLKRVFMLVISIGVFCVSILTDINNEYYAEKFKEQTYKYITFDSAVSSEYFLNREENASVFIPDYMGIHHSMEYMSLYASIYSSKVTEFKNTKEELDFNKTVYMMKYDKISHMMLMGKIDANLKTDELVISSKDNIENKTLIMYKHSSTSSVEVNGENIGGYGNVAIIPLADGVNSINIKSKAIDISKCAIVTGQLQLNSKIDINMGTGFYGQEKWGEDSAYWCENKGEILIENDDLVEKRIVLEMTVATGNSVVSNLKIKNNAAEMVKQLDGTRQKIQLPVNLKPGKNVVALESDAQPLDTNGRDERTLVFYVLNPKIILDDFER